MTKIVGIDLGTTFSAIAVNGKVELALGYPEPHYIEECDVSIIPDNYGNYIIPSALWEDPEQPGELVIGVDAKEAADNGYNPILFSKRNIGTDITYPLGDKTFTARDAAREILVYLKGIAEEALGERIDRAVITHPAYFDPAMKEETAQAAKEAGFNFDPETHLLMEPIAAGLAYTRTDDRDPLRTLTYDLGGGTFDVTAMERRQGVVTVKAFGGNRLLGGFNFDRELAQWLLDRLQKRGVQINLDKDNPEDQGKWKQLLRLAEDTKINLAKARTDKKPVNIRQQNIFKDNNDRPINLTDKINRQQFTELIQELLEETIYGKGGAGETKGCNLVLAEVGWTIEQVDEILLVGGSTYAPWINETIEKAWKREPKLCSEPDLYVAAGSAIRSITGVEMEPKLCSEPDLYVAVGASIHSITGVEMEPNLMEFESILSQIKNVLSTTYSEFKIQFYCPKIEILEKIGYASYSKKEKRRWELVNNLLNDFLKEMHHYSGYSGVVEGAEIVCDDNTLLHNYNNYIYDYNNYDPLQLLRMELREAEEMLEEAIKLDKNNSQIKKDLERVQQLLSQVSS